MNKRELAIEYFKKGFNCCQAVVLAFKDEIGLSEDMLKKASIAFGGGLGRQRLTCGAVSGMCMVIGILKSDGNDKLSAYALVQDACAQFKQQVGSIICAELLDAQSASDTNPKPEERTEAYYKKRPCAELCGIAAEIAEKFIKN